MIEGYHTQNSCRSCAYVFERFEYDEGEEYFCMREGRPAPCGSVAMGEGFYTVYDGPYRANRTDEEAHRLSDIWDLWAEKHRVSCCGVCPNWTTKEGEKANEASSCGL